MPFWRVESPTSRIGPGTTDELTRSSEFRYGDEDTSRFSYRGRRNHRREDRGQNGQFHP